VGFEEFVSYTIIVGYKRQENGGVSTMHKPTIMNTYQKRVAALPASQQNKTMTGADLINSVTQSKEYKEGYAAGQAGKIPPDNPYPDGTSHDLWMEGLMDASL
jgi:hypothetical protein